MSISPARTILIIDDYPDAIRLFTLILTTKGRNDVVKAVSNGWEGLALAGQERPDVVLARLMLPELDGYEICRRFKAAPTLEHIPILLCAAKPPRDVYPEAQRCGAAGYLYEPFRPNELVTALDTVLRGGTYYPPLDG